MKRTMLLAAAVLIAWPVAAALAQTAPARKSTAAPAAQAPAAPAPAPAAPAPAAAPAAPAPVAAAAPDLAKAQTIVTGICAACHGPDGNSVIPVNPRLAGMPAQYITQQLSHFKSGVRANPVMLGMSASLTPDDMKALGVYFSRQKPATLEAKDPSLLKAGQALYRGGDAATGLPACAGCHQPDGSGVPAKYPRLAGQHPEYQYAQLQAFKTGTRGADKEGKDVNGRIMAAVAAKMTDAQMKAVVEYTSALR
jgi:cytochrome c553